jgi:hypothetical protein
MAKLIRPPEISGNTASRVIGIKQEELGEGNFEFDLCSYFEGICNVL